MDAAGARNGNGPGLRDTFGHTMDNQDNVQPMDAYGRIMDNQVNGNHLDKKTYGEHMDKKSYGNIMDKEGNVHLLGNMSNTKLEPQSYGFGHLEKGFGLLEKECFGKLNAAFHRHMDTNGQLEKECFGQLNAAFHGHMDTNGYGGHLDGQMGVSSYGQQKRGDGSLSIAELSNVMKYLGVAMSLKAVRKRLLFIQTVYLQG